MMTMTLSEQVVTVVMAVAATMMTRFLPFVVFRPGRPTPRYILYLGKVLPPSVFALLVVYCLRNIDLNGGWPVRDAVCQVVAVAVTVVVHVWRRNMMWSIAAGTLCYILLVEIKKAKSGRRKFTSACRSWPFYRVGESLFRR